MKKPVLLIINQKETTLGTQVLRLPFFFFLTWKNQTGPEKVVLLVWGLGEGLRGLEGVLLKVQGS